MSNCDRKSLFSGILTEPLEPIQYETVKTTRKSKDIPIGMIWKRKKTSFKKYTKELSIWRKYLLLLYVWVQRVFLKDIFNSTTRPISFWTKSKKLCVFDFLFVDCININALHKMILCQLHMQLLCLTFIEISKIITWV